MLSFDLKEEVNEVYAELELDNQVYFVVDGNIYSDRTPPTITLYDALDGKTFYADKICVLGKIVGGQTLTINDNGIEIGEDGSFSYDIELSLGENVIEMICEDANGNETSRILTLYRSASIFNSEENFKGWISYLPLMASVLTSILIIILSVEFMKRKEKSSEKKIGVAPFVIWDLIIAIFDGVCWWQFISRYTFSNSIGYLEMAEKSALQAAIYIKRERMYGIMAIAALVIFSLSVMVTVILFKKRNKSKEGD